MRLIGSDARGPHERTAPSHLAAPSGKGACETVFRPDSVANPLLFRFAPKSWHPLLQLARLDRPIGWWLLLLPCWWSSALASVHQGAPLHGAGLLLFFVGAVVMRGAGSTYNDIVDRHIDAKVERTKWRPLASGRIGVTSAKIFLIAQCLIGLAVLLCFNRFTIFLGCASLGVVALYPFMKRISSWPQAVLGAAFAWGALVGWSAVLESLALAPCLLYLGTVFWTIGYDTIYAIQDIEDDVIAGIGSTARFFGSRVRSGVGCLYALAVLFTEAAFLSAGAGAGGVAQGGLILFALHLAWQVSRIDPGNGALALRLFNSNRDAGLLLFAGLVTQVFLMRG